MAGDRPLGAARPVDPATRLSELLAQSLDELTRPFDPPRVDPLTRQQAAPPPPAPAPASDFPEPPLQAANADRPVEARLDADRALAELEAELFANKAAAAERPVQDAPPAAPDAHDLETPAPDEHAATEPAPVADDATAVRAPVDLDALHAELLKPAADAPPLDVVSDENKTAPSPATPDPAAADLIARVRRLMLISMGVTVIAVGSVFGVIGYRMFKGEGSTAKTADKIAPTPATPEMTLSLPRGARIIQAAVAEDRLIMTLDVGGKVEVRTFDIKTLQPAGRLTFSGTP